MSSSTDVPIYQQLVEERGDVPSEVRDFAEKELAKLRSVFGVEVRAD